MTYLILLMMVLCVSACRSDLSPRQDEPPRQEEPEQQWPIEPAQTALPPAPVEASPPGPKPMTQDEYQIVYEAGALAWAKPGYRVIFHKTAQSDAFIQTQAYKDSINDVPPSYRMFHGSPNHTLRFISFASVERFNKSHERLIEIQNHDPKYIGLYLPLRFLHDEVPTLHLLECPKPGSHYYPLGDVTMACNGTYLTVFFPMEKPAGEWFVCQLSHAVESWRSEVLGYLELEPCEQPRHQAYEHVTWADDDPATHAHMEPIVTPYAASVYKYADSFYHKSNENRAGDGRTIWEVRAYCPMHKYDCN